MVFDVTGLRGHVEENNRGPLSFVPELRGIVGVLPHVSDSLGRGGFREHRHDSFSIANFGRKRQKQRERRGNGGNAAWKALVE